MSKLHFRYAAMNAGKSTLLLQAANNYVERGMGVKLFTAELDNRNGVGIISSRLGIQRPAQTFNRDTEFDRSVLDAATACLFVDEAQFLTASQAHQLHRLAHAGKVPIICFGLRTDFLGRAFAGAAALLALADDLQELKAVCGCGKKASMNARIDSAGRQVLIGEQILIGSNGKYLPLCPGCFYGGAPPVEPMQQHCQAFIDNAI